MHPMIQQVRRGAGSLQPHFQRQLLRWLMEYVDPILEAHEARQAERAESPELPPSQTPVKRGPGRPRKVTTDEVPA